MTKESTYLHTLNTYFLADFEKKNGQGIFDMDLLKTLCTFKTFHILNQNQLPALMFLNKSFNEKHFFLNFRLQT